MSLGALVSSSYTYVGDGERYYPDSGVHAAPGVTATFDSKPDDLWVVSSSKKAAAVTAATTDTDNTGA